MTRTEVERDLDFIGFIIFENKLKPSTAGVLKELKDSNIATVMVTGDNILTAISVARECGLLDRHAHCFVPRFLNGKRFQVFGPLFLFHLCLRYLGDSQDPTAELQWESIDNSIYCLDKTTLLVSLGTLSLDHMFVSMLNLNHQ